MRRRDFFALLRMRDGNRPAIDGRHAIRCWLVVRRCRRRLVPGVGPDGFVDVGRAFSFDLWIPDHQACSSRSSGGPAQPGSTFRRRIRCIFPALAVVLLAVASISRGPGRYLRRRVFWASASQLHRVGSVALYRITLAVLATMPATPVVVDVPASSLCCICGRVPVGGFVQTLTRYGLNRGVAAPWPVARLGVVASTCGRSSGWASYWSFFDPSESGPASPQRDCRLPSADQPDARNCCWRTAGLRRVSRRTPV